MQIIRYGPGLVCFFCLCALIVFLFSFIKTGLKLFSWNGWKKLFRCNFCRSRAHNFPYKMASYWWFVFAKGLVTFLVWRSKWHIHIYNNVFVCVIIRVFGEHETYMSKNITIWRIYKWKKTHRSILLLFCRFDMWYHMELSSVKSLKR